MTQNDTTTERPHMVAYNAAFEYLGSQGISSVIGDSVAARIADSVADYPPEWLAEAHTDAEWRTGWAEGIRQETPLMRMPTNPQIAEAIRRAAVAIQGA